MSLYVLIYFIFRWLVLHFLHAALRKKVCVFPHAHFTIGHLWG